MRIPLLALCLTTATLAAAGAAQADPVPDLWVCTPENAETCDILNDPVDHALAVAENPPEPDPCRPVGDQDWC